VLFFPCLVLDRRTCASGGSDTYVEGEVIVIANNYDNR
jgi:hypothetical protein